MKKIITLLLVITMSLSLVACAGNEASNESNGTSDTNSESSIASSEPSSEPSSTAAAKTPQDFKTFKIGVCEAMANDESVIRRDYYENYIAPKYNVQFVFSEQCKSDEDEQNFIANSIDAGCDAIITYRGNNIVQMLPYCDERGVYYSGNFASALPADFDPNAYEYWCGKFEPDQNSVAANFANWLSASASEDGNEGFLICSALAFQKNPQHLPCTITILNTLKDRYGLTYNDTVENIALTDAPLAVENDKGINIYIYPGSPMISDTWLPGVTALLQTGKYGAVMHMGQYYTNTAVVVDEVEQSFNKDIKVASVAAMSETLTNAFNAKDKFGNPSLNMANIKPVSLISSEGFVRVYNALTGYNAANIATDGKIHSLQVNFLSAVSLEEINAFSKFDVAGGSDWIGADSVINQVLCIYNETLTAADIQEVYSSIGTDEILNR